MAASLLLLAMALLALFMARLVARLFGNPVPTPRKRGAAAYRFDGRRKRQPPTPFAAAGSHAFFDEPAANTSVVDVEEVVLVLRQEWLASDEKGVIAAEARRQELRVVRTGATRDQRNTATRLRAAAYSARLPLVDVGDVTVEVTRGEGVLAFEE